MEAQVGGLGSGTLGHEAQSGAGDAAGIHADAGRGQPGGRSRHQIGAARYVAAAGDDGTPWALNQAAHHQISSHLRGHISCVKNTEPSVVVSVQSLTAAPLLLC